MKVKKLIEMSQKPEVYSAGTAIMWTDEYISTQLLETHLNQQIDLASRRETTITSTIEWILSKIPGKGLKILDLGCGPGLYTEKLAEKGHNVTGVDFSANSINYARESAKKKKLNISYLQQNYLELNEENQYDLVMMIFTDFGVLLPEQRKTLLNNIYSALKPGGIFVFDVLNDNYSEAESVVKEWDLSEKGFWRNSPYLALSESFFYEKEKVSLSQHTIIDDTGEIDVYRFWIHTFSNAELEKNLVQHKFCASKCYNNILPASSMYRSEDITFCITKKEC